MEREREWQFFMIVCWPGFCRKASPRGNEEGKRQRQKEERREGVYSR